MRCYGGTKSVVEVQAVGWGTDDIDSGGTALADQRMPSLSAHVYFAAHVECGRSCLDGCGPSSQRFVFKSRWLHLEGGGDAGSVS
jgi:hypothetical protein